MSATGSAGQDNLQVKVDTVLKSCQPSGNLVAKAISSTGVAITFIDPPDDLSSDRELKCVLKGLKAAGVTAVGVVGREQYMDEGGKKL